MNAQRHFQFVSDSLSARAPRVRALFCVIACALLAPTVFGVTPPPGGGYPNEVTALGDSAVLSLTTGDGNTAVGFQALYSDTTGDDNTALGGGALHDNTTGGANIGIGFQALYGNTTGTYNVAVGENALVANTTGGGSVGVGYTALEANTNSYGNVAVGFGAMSFSTTSSYNTALGNTAMAFNSTGSENTAVGDSAMNKSSGSGNIAVGWQAGLNFAGDNNVALGQFAGLNVTTGSQNIEIGNEGNAADTGVIRLGTERSQTTTYVAGIRHTPLASALPVTIGPDGQLGVRASSARYKEAIKPMAQASEVLLALKPVTFRYKKAIDPAGQPQYGLVAEEVAKVDPDLVARDEAGKPYTVRYDEVNAMLLNEFLKEHGKVEEQGATIARLEASAAEQQKTITALTAGLKAQAAQIQKVNERLDATPAAPRLVSAHE